MIKRLVRAALRPMLQPAEACPADCSSQNREIFNLVQSCTMTSPERVNALVDAVQYVARNGIEGALVECGVWKGGSAMAMALALQRIGAEARDIFLYDTFAGMPRPGAADVSFSGEAAEAMFSQTRTSEDSSDWCRSPLEEVRRNVLGTGYPAAKIRFIPGKVEDTIPEIMPDKIALLRLDTDWYESTRHELRHLFPLLQPRGVLLIDDYGHWQGARKAVDEYIRDHGLALLLCRIDCTGRIAVKTA